MMSSLRRVLFVSFVICSSNCWTLQQRQKRSAYLVERTPPSLLLSPQQDRQEYFTRNPRQNSTILNGGNSLNEENSLKHGIFKDFHIKAKRNKRSAYLPYTSSNKVPRSSSSRYRYPLYRKRTNKIDPYYTDNSDWESSDYDSSPFPFPKQNEDSIISYLIASNLMKNQNGNSMNDQKMSQLFPYANVKRSFGSKRSKRSKDNQRLVPSKLALIGRRKSVAKSSVPLNQKSANGSVINNGVNETDAPVAASGAASGAGFGAGLGETSVAASEVVPESVVGDKKRLKRGERMDSDLKSDLLARKYFSILSQSYGEKKRSVGKYFGDDGIDMESLIVDPNDVEHLEQLILDAEDNIANDAEEELSAEISGQNGKLSDEMRDKIFSEAALRLTFLEKMKKALMKLELEMFMDKVYKRAQNLATESSFDFPMIEKVAEKRRKTPHFYDSFDSNLRKKSDQDSSSTQTNTREECPVFERIVVNCAALTKVTHDNKNLFLEPCIRHEMCYMCGGGMDITRPQCDAIFSSSLELECIDGNSGDEEEKQNCMQRGQESLKVLNDPTRFDAKGSCTYDPCVRQLLESR